MYRLLRERGETGDRRRHATHPAQVKPELLATAPNQCWSWDLTKLAGPARWTWFYLYVISTSTAAMWSGGWSPPGEAASLAERLLADLGVTRSHSRPHVPDDNPYSQGQFKTPQAPPGLPGPVRLHPGRSSVLPAVLRLVQPRAPPQRDRAAHPRRRSPRPRRQIITARAAVLEGAYAAHPERFVGKPPTPPRLPRGGMDQQAHRPTGAASATALLPWSSLLPTGSCPRAVPAGCRLVL
jgi:putative transposase